MRIIEPNSTTSGILIPVWDFFGTATYYNENNGQTVPIKDYDLNKSYLTINAIDGSVIDRNLGY